MEHNNNLIFNCDKPYLILLSSWQINLKQNLEITAYLFVVLRIHSTKIPLKYLVSPSTNTFLGGAINDIIRSAHGQKQPPKVFHRKWHSSIFCNISSKTAVLESLFNKAAGLQACNFVKKRLQHRCFHVNGVKFLRTPISKKICKQLLLPWNPPCSEKFQ